MTKSVAQKLGLNPGKTLLVKDAPAPLERLLGVLPEAGTVVETGAGPFPLMLLFVKDRHALERALPAAKAKLQKGGALWVAYVKGTSKLATGINRDSIRNYAHTQGLDAVSLVAIDNDWSALRLKVIEESP